MNNFNDHSSLIALQLVGSPTSKFFFDLSVLYASGVSCPDGFELRFALAYPDGTWSYGDTLDTTAHRTSLQELVPLVQSVDLVVPHMFCPKGLTSIRTFFEENLNLPLVGSPGTTLGLAQSKSLTKLIATEANVRVPQGWKIGTAILSDELRQQFTYPLIVKPNSADNSDGLSLVTAPAQLDQALEHAFAHDTEVLIEVFIAGRELRGALIERSGGFHFLPFIEYGVTEAHPIRGRADKYKFDEGGKLLAQSDKINVPATCPATIAPALETELREMMVRMHRALGCRDYSMYDFRVDAATGVPYLLEAGLFWSFGEASMISAMLRAQGTDLQQLTSELWRVSAGSPSASPAKAMDTPAPNPISYSIY